MSGALRIAGRLGAALLLCVLWPGVAAAKLVLPPQTPTDQALQMAWSHIEAGRDQQARRLLLRVIELNPDSARAYVLLGRTYLRDAPAEARKAAIAALRRSLRSQEALDLLSASFARMRAQGLPAARESELRALEVSDYDQVLQRHPGWIEARFRRASQLVGAARLLPAGDGAAHRAMLERAVADLRRVLDGFDDTTPPVVRASANFQLGRAYQQMGERPVEASDGSSERERLREDAARQFSKTFRIDPERVDAIAELVRVRRDQAEAGRAIEEVTAAAGRAGLAPAAAASLNALLGNLYIETGRARDALAPMQRAVALNAQMPQAWLGLFRAHLALDDDDGAYAAMERAVAAIPRLVTGHLELGRMDAGRGDHEKAIERFQTLLEVPPDDAVVIGTRPSRNAFRNARYHAAASWLAWLYLDKRGRPADALQAVRLALRYGPLDPSLADTRGWALFRLGRFAEARDVLDPAARASPDAPAIQFHLASTLHALGERDAALAAVERALASTKTFSGRDAALALRRELTAR